jgi:hypothetical protein
LVFIRAGLLQSGEGFPSKAIFLHNTVLINLNPYNSPVLASVLESINIIIYFPLYFLGNSFENTKVTKGKQGLRKQDVLKIDVYFP